MTSKNLAPLDEVSVAAKFEESGISASAKSRAITAIDRLIGAAVDWVGVGVEGSRDRRRAIAEAAEQIEKARGDIALEVLENDPDLRARVGRRLIEDSFRKQKNLDAIAAMATESLLALPPPDGRSLGDDEVQEAPTELDDDWLNAFANRAENASSERLRRVWARVLAGEIRSPGAFSLSTIRFLEALDAEIAQAFALEAEEVLNDDFIPLAEGISGERFFRLKLLEECGLLFGVTGNVHKELVLTSAQTFHELVGLSGLIIKGDPDQKIQIKSAFLSRVGKELLRIIDRTENINHLALSLTKHMPKDGLVSIELASVDRVSGGQIIVLERRNLWLA